MTDQETTTGEELLENEAEAIITQVEGLAPDAVRLAELVSIAARIEPELLRIMRLKLLPKAGAGVEADLWFSPLVQSRSSENLVLLAEVVDALRARLANPQHPIGLERAQQVLADAHIHSSSAVRLEEQVTCLALSSDEHKLEKIDRLLQSLMAAILEGEQRGLALARWASHALPRMPAEARGSSAATAVAVGAGVMLGGPGMAGTAPLDEQNWKTLAMAMPANMPTLPVRLRLVSDGLEIGAREPNGAHEVQLPKTNPMHLEVVWQEDGAERATFVQWKPEETIVVPFQGDSITVKPLQGSVYTLRRRLYELFIAAPESEQAWVTQQLLPALPIPAENVVHLADLAGEADFNAAAQRALANSRTTLLVTNADSPQDPAVIEVEQLAQAREVQSGQSAQQSNINQASQSSFNLYPNQPPVRPDSPRPQAIRLVRQVMPIRFDAPYLPAVDFSDPAQFHSSLRQLADLLGLALPQPATCPFPGPAPFQTGMQLFGREREAQALAQELIRSRAVLVSGPSGSGKSSLVNAGLIPQLHAQTEGGWLVRYLPTTGDLMDRMMAIFPHAERGRISPEWVDQLLSEEGARTMLLVIDPLEALLDAMHQDSSVAGWFIDTLVNLYRSPNIATLFVTGSAGLRQVRDDWFLRLAGSLPYNNLQSPYLVEPLKGAALAYAITEAARTGGRQVEPRLAEQLVREAQQGGAGMALLQALLVELWNSQAGGVLSEANYRALGGLGGAATRLADQVYSAMDAGLQAVARRVLPRLAEKGEPVPVSELLGVGEGWREQELGLRALASARLVTLDERDGRPYVQLGHPAFSAWPMLQRWKEEERSAHLADELYNSFNAREQELTRRILLRLAGTSEPLPVSGLAAPGDNFQEYQKQLDALADAHLIRTTLQEGRHYVQLSHPTLNDWPVLQRWKEEEQAAREALQKLEDHAGVWGSIGAPLDVGLLLLEEEDLSSIDKAFSILEGSEQNLSDHTISFLEASRRYHQEKQQPSEAKPSIQLRWPVDSPVVIQRFGEKPGAYRAYGLPGHDGIDFEAPAGAIVYACADGQVIQGDEQASPRQAASKMAPARKASPRSQPDERLGIQVRIEHELDDGSVYQTIYAHLSEALVAAGDTVQAGQEIGRAGSSGNTSGPHLHLALKIEGASSEGYLPGFVDPWPYLQAPPAQGKLPVVAVTRLNLRAAPDTGAAVIASLPQGRPVTVLSSDLADAQAKLGQPGHWLQVQLPDGITGWAAAQYLSVPYRYGFRFINSFQAEGQSAINLPVFGSVEIGNLVYGLSGGMVYAALDYHQAGMPLPEYEDANSLPAALYQYLQKRQLDSLAISSMAKLAQWTLLEDPEIQSRARRSELPRLRKMLDSGQPAAVMLIRSHNLTSLSQNQVVLVTGIEQDQGDTFSMLAYDPNFPGKDALLEIKAEGSWQEKIIDSDVTLAFRGLFILPYKPYTPPDLEPPA